MMNEDTAVTSAGRRRRRPIEPFSSIIPASGDTGATNTAGGGAISMQSGNNHHSNLPHDDVAVSVDALGKSLATFSSKVDGTLQRARHLTDQAEAAASHALDEGAPSATRSHPAATGASTAAQFLSDQQNRTNRISQRLEAVADALLQFPADQGGGGDIASLADLTRLCASVYEANAVQLAVVEDAMVHGGNGDFYGEIDSNDGMLLQGRYDGMDARRAAIAAMERRQMTARPDDYDCCDASAAGISVHAANVTDDASTIGSLGSLGNEELLTDGIIGDVGIGTGPSNSSRTPLGSMSDNTALGDGANQQAKVSCHYNGLPLEAISEGEAESSSSSSGSSGDGTSAAAVAAADGCHQVALVEKDICSPSPTGLSMTSAVMTPATPATPSLADLHLSQCTIDTLESAQDDDVEDQDGPARDDGRSSSEEDEEELCMTAAPRRSDMEEFIGDGDSIGCSASLLNDSDYVQASVAEIVEVGTTFTDATCVEDVDSSRSDEDDDGEDDEDEDFSMAATIERNPVFEETLMNDGCSVATASPTIVADRKLAQMMAQIARGEASAEDKFDVDDDDASSEGSGTSSFSDKDGNSTASESSIDRLIDESDLISETNATVVQERDSCALERVGQAKRRTPILDRYRVQKTSDGYKVSPKDSEAASTSPKVLPFGISGEEDTSGKQHNQNPITAPQRIQPKSKPKRQPTYQEQGRTRKVYPRTPISKFPVPREEDEDDLSETDDELEMATATPPVKAQGFGRLNQEEEDVTSRRLSSSGGDVPFSPQATSTTIKPKANVATNTTTTTTIHSPSEACRTPLAAAWIEKNMPEEKERLLRILSPSPASAPTPVLAASSTTDSRSSTIDRKSSGIDANANLIRHLTPEEYMKAPRIVKSQVSVDEVGAAVTALNAWLLASSHGQKEINEDQAYGLLGDMFNRRKAKTLCMSLCHWKRLLMRGSSEDDGGVIFQVVNL